MAAVYKSGEKESEIKIAEVKEGCFQDGVKLRQTGRSEDGTGPKQYKSDIWSAATGELSLLFDRQPEGDQAPTTWVHYIKA